MNDPTSVLPPGVLAPAPLPPPVPDGPLVALAKALEQAPRTLLDFVVGMVIATLTDPVSLALTVASVALGFAVGSWLVASAAFFFTYVAVRTVNNIAGGIRAAARDLSAQMGQQSEFGPRNT